MSSYKNDFVLYSDNHIKNIKNEFDSQNIF